MSGTKAGSIKAMQKIRQRYPADYFQIIGSQGGKNGRGTSKGFGAGEAGRERARAAGLAGGTKSGQNRSKLATTRKAALKAAHTAQDASIAKSRLLV